MRKIKAMVTFPTSLILMSIVLSSHASRSANISSIQSAHQEQTEAISHEADKGKHNLPSSQQARQVNDTSQEGTSRGISAEVDQYTEEHEASHAGK